MLPYERGDLGPAPTRRARSWRSGTAQDGTELTARVPLGLAAELDSIAVPATS